MSCTRILGVLALALTLPLAACDDSTAVLEPGSMSLLLTDDPGDFDQAVVVIESIELVGESDDEESTVMLREDMYMTDLLTLANDVDELVAETTVPGGSYGQIRFVIPEACISVEQDTDPVTYLVYASSDTFTECGEVDGPLQLPSFAESGLKVNLPAEASEVDGDQHIILLDFNVEESFGQQAGNSGMWVMSPVITSSTIEFTGSLNVDLTAAEGVDLAALGSSLGDYQARMSSEAEPVPFTDDDEDGTYTAEFLYLVPGVEYEVSVELQDDAPAYDFTTEPDSPQSVTLGSAEDATVAFEVTSATASN